MFNVGRRKTPGSACIVARYPQQGARGSRRARKSPTPKAADPPAASLLDRFVEADQAATQPRLCRSRGMQLAPTPQPKIPSALSGSATPAASAALAVRTARLPGGWPVGMRTTPPTVRVEMHCCHPVTDRSSTSRPVLRSVWQVRFRHCRHDDARRRRRRRDRPVDTQHLSLGEQALHRPARGAADGFRSLQADRWRRKPFLRLSTASSRFCARAP